MKATEKATLIRERLDSITADMTDEEAVSNAVLFKAWSGNSVAYKTGDRVLYNDVLYSVLQNHTSQPDWTPANTFALFAKVLIPDPSVIPEWEQPDSTNPYKAGDKVTHNGKTWESTVDNNVWEPGVYGWVEV